MAALNSFFASDWLKSRKLAPNATGTLENVGALGGGLGVLPPCVAVPVAVPVDVPAPAPVPVPGVAGVDICLAWFLVRTMVYQLLQKRIIICRCDSVLYVGDNSRAEEACGITLELAKSASEENVCRVIVS